MATKRNLQRTSQSRLFLIEDRAGPNHPPVYLSLARPGGFSWGQGDVTPIRIPDPDSYGRFVVADKIRGQADLPGLSLDFRMTRDVSAVLKLARKGCDFDVQLHVGACKDPSDFDAGWEKIMVLEGASITNYSTDDLGAFDADQDAAVMETVDLTGEDYYEIKPIAFGQLGETEIVQEVIDVAIASTKTCGECGIPNDGCGIVFAIQTPIGASPGLTAEIIATQNGGATLAEYKVTSLPANRAPSAIAVAGSYLLVLSNTDDSIHIARMVDVLAGIGSWTKITTGIVAAGSPNEIFSLGRTQNWIVGDAGYIYFSNDPASGVTAVQSAGDVTAQNLTCIDGADEFNLIAGGAAGALVRTQNGGTSWTAVTGPSAQSAVAVNAVHMLSRTEWLVAYNDGELWYTTDSGVSWVQKVLPGSLTVIDDMSFSTRSVGYIVGRAVSGATTVGKILRTINGGNSWYVAPETVGLSVPTAVNFNSIAACKDDPNVVYAGGLEAAAGDGILVKGA